MSIDRDRPIQTIRPGLHPSRATIAVATKTRYAERRLGNAWNHRDAADRGWVFICELWFLPNTGFRIANVQRLLDFGPEFYPTNVFDPEAALTGTLSVADSIPDTAAFRLQIPIPDVRPFNHTSPTRRF